MLVKAGSEDISSFQAYTIRRLDQKQSNLTDTEQYKLMNVKEDAFLLFYFYLFFMTIYANAMDA